MTPRTVEDEQRLVAACVQGDNGEWRRFLRRYDRTVKFTVVAVCARYGIAGREIEDLVGHVYEKLVEDDYRRLRIWRAESSLSTYLTQVAKNLSIDYLRSNNKGYRVEMPDDFEAWLRDQAAPAEDITTASDLAELRSAIDALPPKQAILMRLRLEGKSLREIAAIVNLSEGTVFGENARIIELLRKKLLRVRNLGDAPRTTL